MAAKKASAKKTSRKTTAKKTSTRKTGRKVAEDKKDTVEGVDTVAGAVKVDIQPVESTVQGEEPTSHDTKQDKIDELNKPKEEKETPVISSVAQLRETAKADGSTVTTEQVAEARKVEEQVLEEGGKLHRPPAAERSGK